MTKKWFIPLILSISIIISLIIGFFLGKYLCETDDLIVYEIDGRVSCCTLERGQITGTSLGLSGNIDDDRSTLLENLSKVKFNLDGIHNNEDAIKEISEQVREAGGRLIFIKQGSSMTSYD